MTDQDNTADSGNDPAPAPRQAVAIKPYSLSELGELYGMSARTIKKWLLPFKSQIGERVGLFYNNRQVKKIFSLLGEPGE